MSYISQFFGMIFDWINNLTGNYGISIVIFTILFRVLLSPLDIRSRVGQREYTQKMKKIQPEVDMLNKAYANNPEKAQQKIMELRKREKIGLMPKGCLGMLLTYPLLLAFFAVFRNLAAVHLAELASCVDQTAVAQWFGRNGFLWIKNIWQPDVFLNFSEVWGVRKIWIINSISGYIIPQASNIEAILKSTFQKGQLSDYNPKNITDLGEFVQYIENGLAPARAYVKEHFLTSDLIGGNGYYIFPVLAGAVQIFSLNSSTPDQSQVGSNEQQAGAKGVGGFMKVFFPLMFVYFCLVSSTALAIYWITSSLCLLLLNFIVNKVMDKREAKQNTIEGEK